MKRICAVIAFLCMFDGPASAVPIEYKLKTGSTYTYEVVQRSTSEAQSNDIRASHPAERTSKLEITVLAFRDGVYVLEISCGDHRLRRYMRPNGSIIASPGETPPMLPLFATLADGDWQPGKTQASTAMLSQANQSQQNVLSLLR